MSTYRITVLVTGYEQYDVEADDTDAAREAFYDGDARAPIDQETSFVEIESVTPIYDETVTA